MATSDHVETNWWAYEINRLRFNIRVNANLYVDRIPIDGYERLEDNIRRDSAASMTIARFLKSSVEANASAIQAEVGMGEYNGWRGECDDFENALAPLLNAQAQNDQAFTSISNGLLGAVTAGEENLLLTPPPPRSFAYPDGPIATWPDAVPIPQRKKK